MDDTIRLNTCLDFVMNRVSNMENFALMRFGDGERSLMLGRPVSAQEGWSAPDKVTPLGKALREAMSFDDDRIIYGISCPCCDREAYYWYMTNINSRNVTFANIFVNANYYKFIEEFEKIRRDAIVVGNYAGNNNRIGNLNVLKYYPIGNDCVKQWEKEGKKIIQEIIDDYGDQDDLLYVFSAGPLSEVFIAALFKNNPNNCYIDFGSSIDKYIHLKDTRPYTDPNGMYGSRNCWMWHPEHVCFDVSVVLTTYKKPEALERQITAIENQSLKPREILLYQDGITEGYSIVYKQSLLGRFDDVRICEENTGVWKRFDYARSTKSKYVCIFDDDSIPGRRWLENCHFNMMEQEGVYGTIGIVVKNYSKYPYGGFYKVGWLRPYTKRAEVDFVGHSWFVKKKYLDYMFEKTEKYQQFKRAAEDMALSFKCQEKGVSTFVPPHPYFDLELWGSQPDSGLRFGNTSTAISQNSEGCLNMRKALAMYMAEGWSLYMDRRPWLAVVTDLKIRIERVKNLFMRGIKKINRFRLKRKTTNNIIQNLEKV